ncbi:DNA-binding MarR family transcriptional regulator [Diaminobutyricimonas aerilata]|uniref:DNA-binding MarR family transcriptional regulator n=1 Tax=Diaminobutyricimonas aerilata TaxID=1162967 RepID=A0A2M9CG57_9MICO|nr:MarR family transcriptional regulator [Diaminobutyricimonas aerilata]PJJ70869.1 DNA-binding MarR family transcriptional regulator [Diaminobutyricimonas aerilata]
MSEKAVAVDAWEALFRAQVTVLRELQESFPTGELSLTEYDVLFNLSRQPDRRLRIRDLHKHLLLTQPSVSRMVDRLVVRGLVTKSSDPDDGRGTIVEISQPGYELFRRVAIQHADAIARRVGGTLTLDELRTLTELCTKLRLGRA